MLLFEFDDKRILYTGDCRVSIKDLKTMPSLHQNFKGTIAGEKTSGNLTVQTIDHLYVDSTFCSVDRNFPFRGQAVQEALTHIKAWLLGSTNFVIRMSFSARVAHEYVLIQLFEILNLKTHVSAEKFEAYKHIPGISECVTRDPTARIHLCEAKEECMKGKSSLVIRLSSMWYTLSPSIPDNIFARKGNTLTVCYAMHSSLIEVGQMIDYLKPRIVTPLVLPRGCNRKELEFGLKSVSEHPYTYKDYVNDAKAGSDEVEGLEQEKQVEVVEISDSQETVFDSQETVFDLDLADLSPEDEREGIPPTKRQRRISWDHCFSPSPEKKGSQTP